MGLARVGREARGILKLWASFAAVAATVWVVPSWAWIGLAGALALVLDYAALVTVGLGREPTVMGQRIPIASFLLALLLSELPVWVLPAVKLVLLAGALVLGAFESYWVLHVVAASTGATLVHVVLYVVAAFESKRLAERAIAAFSTKGPLGADDGDHPYDSPLALILTRCLHPARPYSSYGVERAANLNYATPAEREALGEAAAAFLRLDVYWDPARTSHQSELKPVAVYIHGGAWSRGLGSKADRVPFVFHMAQQGWVTVSIDYRLWPDEHWPAYVIDCKRALRWIKANIHAYGGDPNFIVVSGGSAGGHLASLLALTGRPGLETPEWQPGFEDVDTSVQGCVAWYPACDTSGEWWAKWTGRPYSAEEHKSASPQHLVEGASSNVASQHILCPFLVVQGEADGLCPAPWVRRFHETLAAHPRKQGLVEYVEFAGAHHSFDLLCSPRSAYANGIVARFCDLVRSEHLRRTEGANLQVDSALTQAAVSTPSEGDTVETRAARRRAACLQAA